MADSILAYAITVGVFIALVILLAISRARRPKAEMIEEYGQNGNQESDQEDDEGNGKIKRYDSDGNPVE